MKEKLRGVFSPRPIDRVVLGILAVLGLTNAAYLVGPWYLDETADGKAPLLSMFNSHTAVIVYGVFVFIEAAALLYASAGVTSRVHTIVTENALLAGFLLRLYALIGVGLTLESWRPPSYLSHAATVAILGAYWVWVKVSVRPVQ